MHGSMGVHEGFQSVAEDQWALKPSTVLFSVGYWRITGGSGRIVAVLQCRMGRAVVKTLLWGCGRMNLVQSHQLQVWQPLPGFVTDGQDCFYLLNVLGMER